uniref:replication restart helicase PriA n=1 Tax=Eubacterium cellulosolvens TaxID=29322 RepID=UPI0004896836|nr:primosomal protein N' [[Eubacterium] cellulosolvens]
MSKRYADVIVDITQASLDKSFQYSIPENLSEKICAGSPVKVPFGGGGRLVDGYVLDLSEKPKIEPERIKPIREVMEDRVSIESKLIRLALWMKMTYGSSLNNALKTVLPVRDKEKRQERIRIVSAVDKDRAQELLAEYRRRRYVAKERLLSTLLEKGEVDRAAAVGTLKVSAETIKSMEKSGIIRLLSTEVQRDPRDLISGTETSVSRSLTEEQRRAVDGICEEWRAGNRPCLLQGVTGSGKTQVYMELIEQTLSEGKQVIVLIPEISLSWQTVRRFRSRFGECVTVLHSKMSRGERFDQFEKIKNGSADIVIGPRSALFSPFPNLGLIIIDEEQENSYRSETAPRYDARETALERARMEGAHVVMGSATPSVDSTYRCEKGEYARFLLEERYGGAVLPDVSIVDMREELRRGNRSILSRELCEKIADRLEKKEQAILFLNRRGFSGFISCRSCGEVMKCPHCDVSLTFHNNGKLVCHYCGYERHQVSRCSVCGSPYISGFRAGTEKVVAELQRFFPEAKILRMDADTTRRKDGFSRILESFASHEADLLVGTQMIVKGHDFPLVTLVGVLAADLSLFASDYRAAEHTYQLLVQAVGRAGRREKAGEAVIQTYHPDHYSIQAAARQDYAAFYEEEIMAREMMGYPPAEDLLAIHGSGMDEEKLDFAMKQLKLFLRRFEKESTVMIGPAPESVTKIRDNYRRVLYVKDSDRKNIILIRRYAEKYIEANEGFSRMLFQYDLNA